jgi:hypothetical protein
MTPSTTSPTSDHLQSRPSSIVDDSAHHLGLACALVALALAAGCGGSSSSATGGSGGAGTPASGGSPGGLGSATGGAIAINIASGGATFVGSGGATLGGGTGGAEPVSSGGAPGSGGQGPDTTGATGGTPASGGAAAGIGGVGAGGSAAGGRTGGGGASSTSGSGGGLPPVPPGGPAYPYIFSVFNDSAALSDLIIYTSTDALNFTMLYDTKYTGPTGFLRDPSIMKHTDGKFYVAFTTPPTMACCGADSSFSIASSADLKTWTTVTTVPAGVPGVKNTWAPEWFKDSDGSVYALVNVDTKTYRYKAMNDTLTTFSAPTWIGIGPDYIDTFMLKIGATYHAFTKHESVTYIEHATATSIDGPWTFVGQNDWAGWGNHKEAPALIDLGNGTWRIFCDAGGAGHEMYSDSADMFKTWTTMKTLPTVGVNISHGTVIHGM